jgi:hypothetical protein
MNLIPYEFNRGMNSIGGCMLGFRVCRGCPTWCRGNLTLRREQSILQIYKIAC